MRPILLLIIPLLLISFLVAAPAHLQDPPQNTLPNPADFVETGPDCRRKVKVSPWVGTPGVDWPNTFQCVLAFHTCEGVKHSRSAVRRAGTGMCDDYWRVHNELAERMICCDPGSRDKTSPAEKPTPDPNCQPATPWFDASVPCSRWASPELDISGSTATLYMCGYPVYSYTDSNLSDSLFANAYKAALRDQLNGAAANRVCCDRFREAMRTGKPCDPRADLDCDRVPNKTDIEANNMPDIQTYTKPDPQRVDNFPESFDSSSLDFLPNRTARSSTGVGDCPCKWELTKGELNCSSDGKQRHYYKATWRCPTTGAEVFTVRYAPATAPCEKTVR